MAITVPTYGPRKVTNSPVAAPQRRAAGVDSFGGVVASNASSVGLAAAEVGFELRKLGDRIATTEAEDAFVRFERDKVEILNNPDSGFFSRKGRDAYDSFEPTQEQLNKLREQYSSQLGGMAREKFDKAAETALLRDRESMARYSAQQYQAWDAAVLQARADNALKSAAGNWNNTEQLALDFEIGRQAVAAAVMQNGGDAELASYAVQDFSSAFYKAAVSAATLNSAEDGKKTLAQFEGYINSNDEMALQREINQKEDQERVRRVANQAVIKATNIVNDYWWYPDARNYIIDQVNKIEDPELRDKTMTEAIQGLNQRLQGRAEEQNMAYMQAQEFILQGGTPTQLQAQDPALWMTMTPDQRIRLMQPVDVKTNLETWTNLQLNYTPDELAQLTPVDLAELSTQLNPTDYKKLVDTIKGIREGNEETRIGWTRAAQATSVMKQIFGDKPDYEQQRAFMFMLNSEYAAQKRQLGRDLNYEETEALYGKLSARYVVENKFLGIPYTSETGLEDIPAEVIPTITRILQENGYDVSAPSIIQFYNQNKDSF